MIRAAILAGCGAFVILTGCMTSPSDAARITTYYDCGNGTRLKVDSLSADQITVQMNDDEPVILPAEKSASGAKYMTARHQFWSKGDEVMWTVGRMTPMICQKVSVPRAT